MAITQTNGFPINCISLAANSTNYLEQHLCNIIEKIGESLPMQLISIAIGHNVTRYYRRGVTIIEVKNLDILVIKNSAALFAKTKDLPIFQSVTRQCSVYLANNNTNHTAIISGKR